MTALFLFDLLYLFSFVTAFHTPLVKLILWLKFSTAKMQTGHDGGRWGKDHMILLHFNKTVGENSQMKNQNHRKLIKLITWTTALPNSMKLWAMPCRTTQDGRVLVDSSDKMWSTGEGNGKSHQYSCLENPMNSMKRQKDRTLKDELPKLVGAQYAPRDQWRNNSRNNEGMEPKQKQHPTVDVTSDGSKVWYYKEQYCIGTWNGRSMNQVKLEVVKQEMARVNIDIVGISGTKMNWNGWI